MERKTLWRIVSRVELKDVLNESPRKQKHFGGIVSWRLATRSDASSRVKYFPFWDIVFCAPQN